MQQMYKIRLELEPDPASGVFTVTSPDVPGLVTEGSTPAEISANVQEAVEALLLGLAEFGLELPPALRPENAVSPSQMELLVAA
jgi:antitoxin HicB